MQNNFLHYHSQIEIYTDPESVWAVLTDIRKMTTWMADPEMSMEIITDWTPGGDIIIKGFHHVAFENKGRILVFEKPHRLSYTHLSSLSRLPDEENNHAVFTFTLKENRNGTLLTLDIHNCVTETIYKHLEFYWNTTLIELKHQAEKEVS